MYIIKVTNKQSGQIQQSDFKTRQEADAWVVECQSKNSWGKLDEYDMEILEEKDKLSSISPRQIRLALFSLGITESFVDNAISNLPSPQKEMALIAWKFSNEYNRDVEAISQIGLMLGLNSDQLDHLWKIGSSL